MKYEQPPRLAEESMESQKVKAMDIFKLKVEKQQKLNLQISLKLAKEDMELEKTRLMESLGLEEEQNSKLAKHFELAVKEMELRQAKEMEIFIRNLEEQLLELAAAFKLSEEETEFHKVVEKNKNILEIARLKRVNVRLQEELEKISDVHEEEMNKMNQQNERLIFHQSEYRKHAIEKINRKKIQIEEKDLVIKSQNAIIRSQREKTKKQDANIEETDSPMKITIKVDREDEDSSI